MSNKQLLDKASQAYGKPELDLFSVPPTQVGVEDSFYTEVPPQHGARPGAIGPYNFFLPANQFMTDLSKNYMYVRMKITNANGSNLQAPNPPARPDPVCSAVNMLGKTMFEQLKLELNGKMIYDSTDTYSYNSYIGTLLNFGREAKESQLRACGYEKDAAGQLDTTDAGNPAYQTRGRRFETSNYVEMMTKLDFPLANQERYLLPNMSVNLSLTRHKDRFLLMSAADTDTYRLEIVDIRWFVRQVEVTPALEMSLHSALQRQNAKYPVRRCQIKTLYMPPGSTQVPANSLWSGQIPRRIIIGMIAENAFNGTRTTNPFNFQHFSVRKVWIVANGETYPKRGKPLEMNFDAAQNKYMQLYTTLYETMGMAGTDKGLDLTPDDIAGGYCLIAIDLKADIGEDSETWETVRSGSTSVHIELGTPAPANTQGVRVICLAEFENLMSITKNLSVYTDFAV